MSTSSFVAIVMPQCSRILREHRGHFTRCQHGVTSEYFHAYDKDMKVHRELNCLAKIMTILEQYLLRSVKVLIRGRSDGRLEGYNACGGCRRSEGQSLTGVSLNDKEGDVPESNRPLVLRHCHRCPNEGLVGEPFGPSN